MASPRRSIRFSRYSKRMGSALLRRERSRQAPQRPRGLSLGRDYRRGQNLVDRARENSSRNPTQDGQLQRPGRVRRPDTWLDDADPIFRAGDRSQRGRSTRSYVECFADYLRWRHDLASIANRATGGRRSILPRKPGRRMAVHSTMVGREQSLWFRIVGHSRRRPNVARCISAISQRAAGRG